MPTYEYVCKKCGKELEVFQKMTDPKLEKCPACGKKAPAKRKNVVTTQAPEMKKTEFSDANNWTA